MQTFLLKTSSFELKKAAQTLAGILASNMGLLFSKNLIQKLGLSFGPINLFQIVLFSLSVCVLSNKQTKQIELCTFPSASVSPWPLEGEQQILFEEIYKL